MKKIIIFVLTLIGISMSGCASTTTQQITTTTTTTTTTTNDPTTSTEEQTTTSFVVVDTATIETDRATFVVQINTNTIDDSNPVVTVVVSITAKEEIDQEIGTSSYGDEGIIGLRIVSVFDDEISLYSEYYDIPFTPDSQSVHLDIGDSLSRSIQFARMPFHGGAGGELPSPIGTYKVQVALFAPAMAWIDTALFITVV